MGKWTIVFFDLGTTELRASGENLTEGMAKSIADDWRLGRESIAIAVPLQIVKELNQASDLGQIRELRASILTAHGVQRVSHAMADFAFRNAVKGNP